MRRTYIVCTGPVMVPLAEEGGNYAIVVPPTEHKVYGTGIKYVAAPDSGQLQVIDIGGAIVFATPIHMLLWLKVEQSEPTGEMSVVNIEDVV